MSDFVLALTTLPADFDATALANDLVGGGLAACVNVLPAVTSVYTWKGVPQVDREQQLFIKTTSDRVDALWEVLRSPPSVRRPGVHRPPGRRRQRGIHEMGGGERGTEEGKA